MVAVVLEVLALELALAVRAGATVGWVGLVGWVWVAEVVAVQGEGEAEVEVEGEGEVEVADGQIADVADCLPQHSLPLALVDLPSKKQARLPRCNALLSSYPQT